MLSFYSISVLQYLADIAYVFTGQQALRESFVVSQLYRNQTAALNTLKNEKTKSLENQVNLKPSHVKPVSVLSHPIPFPLLFDLATDALKSSLFFLLKCNAKLRETLLRAEYPEYQGKCSGE